MNDGAFSKRPEGERVDDFEFILFFH